MIPIQPVEGSSLTGPVASITSGNPNSVAGDFAAIIDWGDGVSSTVIVVVADVDAPGREARPSSRSLRLTT
jgi:hypothetical protein